MQYVVTLITTRDMPCSLLFVKVPLAAGECVKAVFHLLRACIFCRVENPFAVLGFDPFLQAEVFCCKTQQEGHRSGAVGKCVEYIQCNLVPGATGLEHISAVVFERENVHRIGLAGAGEVLQAVEIPPEESFAKGIGETREAVYYILECPVERLFINFVIQIDADPELDGVSARPARGVYDCGVVQPCP